MKKRKQGRPRVPESKKRNKYFCINCNAAEYKMFEYKAGKLKIRKSTLVRMAVEKFNVDE